MKENKKIDDELIWLIREWQYLSVGQKKKIMWIIHRELIKLWIPNSQT